MTTQQSVKQMFLLCSSKTLEKSGLDGGGVQTEITKMKAEPLVPSLRLECVNCQTIHIACATHRMCDLE